MNNDDAERLFLEARAHWFGQGEFNLEPPDFGQQFVPPHQFGPSGDHPALPFGERTPAPPPPDPALVHPLAHVPAPRPVLALEHFPRPVQFPEPFWQHEEYHINVPLPIDDTDDWADDEGANDETSEESSAEEVIHEVYHVNDPLPPDADDWAEDSEEHVASQGTTPKRPREEVIDTSEEQPASKRKCSPPSSVSKKRDRDSESEEEERAPKRQCISTPNSRKRERESEGEEETERGNKKLCVCESTDSSSEEETGPEVDADDEQETENEVEAGPSSGITQAHPGFFGPYYIITDSESDSEFDAE